ncbi:hypothetical protein PM082_000268 [Marasmius tenuissimus]|nr:hypothetical protein PM082_000268 [Marasmius tenuissimus]
MDWGPRRRVVEEQYESDIYSYGSVCYSVLRQLYNLPKTTARGEDPPPPSPVNLPDDKHSVWSLLHDCWRQEPSSRPTATDLVKRILATDATIVNATPWSESLYSSLGDDVDPLPLFVHTSSSPESPEESTTHTIASFASPSDSVSLNPLLPGPPLPRSTLPDRIVFYPRSHEYPQRGSPEHHQEQQQVELQVAPIKHFQYWYSPAFIGQCMGGSTSFSTPPAFRTFTDEDTRATHVETHKGANGFKCGYCSKEGFTENTVERHASTCPSNPCRSNELNDRRGRTLF